MARKRQYKKRQDYRKGGRVRYQDGGDGTTGGEQAEDRKTNLSAEEQAKKNREAAEAARAAQQKDIYSEGTQTDFDTTRTEAQKIKEGTSTFAGPAPVKDLDTRAGFELSQVERAFGTQTQTGRTQIEKIDPTGTQATTTDAADVTMDTAQLTDPAAQAQTQAPIVAGQYTAATTAQAPVVDAATGTLSPEAQAQVDEIRELSGPAAATQFE